MKTVFFLIGLVFLGLFFALGWDAIQRIERLRDVGHFSLRVWEDWFWLQDPDRPLAGFAPNGLWFLESMGALLGLIVGWSFTRTSMRMRD